MFWLDLRSAIRDRQNPDSGIIIPDPQHSIKVLFKEANRCVNGVYSEKFGGSRVYAKVRYGSGVAAE